MSSGISLKICLSSIYHFQHPPSQARWAPLGRLAVVLWGSGGPQCYKTLSVISIRVSLSCTTAVGAPASCSSIDVAVFLYAGVHLLLHNQVHVNQPFLDSLLTQRIPPTHTHTPPLPHPVCSWSSVRISPGWNGNFILRGLILARVSGKFLLNDRKLRKSKEFV